MWMSVEDDDKIKKPLQITENEVSTGANVAKANPVLLHCFLVACPALLSAIKRNKTAD